MRQSPRPAANPLILRGFARVGHFARLRGHRAYTEKNRGIRLELAGWDIFRFRIGTATRGRKATVWVAPGRENEVRARLAAAFDGLSGWQREKPPEPPASGAPQAEPRNFLVKPEAPAAPEPGPAVAPPVGAEEAALPAGAPAAAAAVLAGAGAPGAPAAPPPRAPP